uniref:Uncharacterized protein n=1 Tax=Arundo donax TaxID=35708 RepID=A0A0A9BK33_ARUDO
MKETVWKYRSISLPAKRVLHFICESCDSTLTMTSLSASTNSPAEEIVAFSSGR